MMRVLIVDDKGESRYLLRALLEGHGCEVDEAVHGAEALVKARQTPPDLVVSDLLMPVMDGYTLLRHWKADPRLAQTPFVVYTATYTDPGDEALARELGADAYIVKPAEPESLITQLRDALGIDRFSGPKPPRQPAGEPGDQFRAYSAVLFRKLEKKVGELEQSNRKMQADIAARKQAEETLRLRDNELAHLSRLHTVGEMAAALAHELNQPLYAIGNYVGGMEAMLRDRGSAGDAKDLLAAIGQVSREVARAAAIVDRLREFVRRDAPRHAATDLARTLHQATELMGPLARNKGVRLEVRVRDAIPSLQADAVQIEQVVVNLLANAIDAVGELPAERRLVTIEANAADAGHVEIAVHDQGEGVPVAVREKLFEPFTSTKEGGLGMGLAISRSIVRAHGGALWAVHRRPHGTSFQFTLPLQSEETRDHAG